MLTSIQPSSTRVRPVDHARYAFLVSIKSMRRGERPVDIELLLQLADVLLEAHDLSMQPVTAATVARADGSPSAA